jgi:hypothetical protein
MGSGMAAAHKSIDNNPQTRAGFTPDPYAQAIMHRRRGRNRRSKPSPQYGGDRENVYDACLVPVCLRLYAP